MKAYLDIHLIYLISRIFGSVAFKHISKQLQHKLIAKSERLIFVGYANRGHALRLWYRGTKCVSVSTHVCVCEPLSVHGDGILDHTPHIHIYHISHSSRGTV